jgi:perosamine synthetase
MQAMKRRGIQTQIGTFALHLQPAFTDTARHGGLDNTAKLYRNLLTLPLHHQMTADDQRYVAAQLAEVLATLS